VIAVETPIPDATPTRPTPTVPAVVHELPMVREMTPQISALAA
jgi:hypothetical protein